MKSYEIIPSQSNLPGKPIHLFNSGFGVQARGEVFNVSWTGIPVSKAIYKPGGWPPLYKQSIIAIGCCFDLPVLSWLKSESISQLARLGPKWWFLLCTEVPPWKVKPQPYPSPGCLTHLRCFLSFLGWLWVLHGARARSFSSFEYCLVLCWEYAHDTARMMWGINDNVLTKMKEDIFCWFGFLGVHGRMIPSRHRPQRSHPVECFGWNDLGQSNANNWA